MGKRIDWPIEEMTKWYEEGMSLQQIGDRLGKDFRLVHKALKKAGVQMRPRGWCNQRGSRNVSWKGGRQVDKAGYVLIRMPDHPAANNNGYVREHRLVAEKMLGRPLKPEEVVHHKNDDTSDNRPENLVVYETNAQHLAETLKGKVPQWTEEGKARIRAAVRRPRKRAASPCLSVFDDDQWQRMLDRLTG